MKKLVHALREALVGVFTLGPYAGRIAALHFKERARRCKFHTPRSYFDGALANLAYFIDR